MALFFLIWIGCAVACGAIASGKNRSGFGWFLLGLILGIVGLVIIAALPRAENYLDTPQGRLESGRAKKCPECAELVQPDARVCKHCGTRFMAPPEPEPDNRPLRQRLMERRDWDYETGQPKN